MNRLIAVAIAAFAAAHAHAGFLDERTPAPAPAPAVVGPTPAASSKASAAGAVPAPKAPEPWVLRSDRPIHIQLEQWANEAGWRLYWRLEKSWRPPADATFTGSFDRALEEVIRGLFAEGKPVHLRIWDGNRVAEIVQSTPQ